MKDLAVQCEQPVELAVNPQQDFRTMQLSAPALANSSSLQSTETFGETL